MSNKLHKNLTDDDIHVSVAKTYADITARDADAVFHGVSTNINKIVRVDSPLSYYILSAITPTWTEFTNTANDTLAEILANGNITGGNDLIVSAGDDLIVTDHMTVGSAAAPATDTSIHLTATDAAFLGNRLTTAQRDALTPIEGMEIYNLTTNTKEYYNDVGWVPEGGGDVTGPASSILNSIAFFSNISGKIIDDAVGITTDGFDLDFVNLGKARFGTGSHLQIFHTGTQADIENLTGNLTFKNQGAANGDIVLDNDATTKGIINRLGTITDATSFSIENSSSEELLTVLGGGNIGINAPIPTSKLTMVETPPANIGVWTLQTGTPDLGWIDIASDGNCNMVAISEDGADRVMTSSDSGVTWVNVSTPLDGEVLRGIAFGAGTFVVVAYGNNNFMTSTDNGATWTQRNSPSNNQWRSVAYSAVTGRFVIVNSAGAEPKSGYSDDLGVTWSLGQTSGGGGLNNQLFNDITWGDFAGGRFVAIANDGVPRAWYSADGDTWTQATTGPTSTPISLAYGDQVYVAVNSGGSIVRSIDGGANWIDDVTPNTNNWKSIAFLNGVFMAVSDSGTGDRAVSSIDGGVTWTVETTPADNNWRGVAAGAFSFVAVGNTGTGDRAMTVPLTGTAAAILDLQSVSSGFLPPRMTTAQRDLIPSPVEALEVYNLTLSEYQQRGASEWFSKSVNGPTVHEIHTSAQFEALAVGGVITITEDTTIKVLADLATSSRFEVSGGDLIITGDYNQEATLTYSWTGTFVTITGGFDFRARARIRLASSSTGTFVSFTGSDKFSGVSLGDATVQGWDDLGTLNNGFLQIVTSVAFVLNDAPFKLIDANLTGAGVISAFSSGRLFDFSTTDGSEGIATSLSDLRGLNVAVPLIRVDPFLVDNQRIFLSIVESGGAGIFDTTGGTSGSYTVVADSSIGSTSITSVTDNGGNAVFNHAGSDPHLGSTVVLSGYITNTDYNGTGVVSVVAAGTFEVTRAGINVAFGTDEAAGNFTMTGITITSTSHGLSQDDTLQISGGLSTQYDGGYRIYNILSNSFDVAATFGTTEAGAWDTSGLNESNPNVLVFNAVEDKSSKYIASSHVNNNATSIAGGGFTNGVFRDMLFGTVGSALLIGSTMERFKLTDELNGEHTYIGNEPYDDSIPWSFYSSSSGGSVKFTYKWQISPISGGGYVDFPDNREVPVEVGSVGASAGGSQPMLLVKGDKIKPLVERDSGASAFLTQNAQIG